jgi:uncharacterized protein (TIGR03435 family)
MRSIRARLRAGRFGGQAVAAIFSLAGVIPLGAQAPVLEPRVSFEVASVKADTSQTRTPMAWQPGGHFVGGVPALSFISIGYLVPVYRIEGMPDWARTTRFLVNAKAKQQPEIEERPAYYRGLLVDRFRFAAHVELRDMDVYTLTLARSDGSLGPGLRRSDVNCDAVNAENRRRNLAGLGPELPAPGERPRCLAAGGPASMISGATELAPLVGMLAGVLGRPVIDKTGLTGRFDINFRAAPPGAREGSPGAALPPISTALEDQLGLKLQTGRGSVEVLVIDRLEMPTEN